MQPRRGRRRRAGRTRSARRAARPGSRLAAGHDGRRRGRHAGLHVARAGRGRARGASGRTPTSTRSGAMLYHLLAGHMPYVTPGDRGCNNYAIWCRVQEGPPPPLARAGRRTMPAELVAICEKAMAREPAQRYADMLGAGRGPARLPRGPRRARLRDRRGGRAAQVDRAQPRARRCARGAAVLAARGRARGASRVEARGRSGRGAARRAASELRARGAAGGRSPGSREERALQRAATLGPPGASRSCRRSARRSGRAPGQVRATYLVARRCPRRSSRDSRVAELRRPPATSRSSRACASGRCPDRKRSRSEHSRRRLPAARELEALEGRCDVRCAVPSTSTAGRAAPAGRASPEPFPSTPGARRARLGARRSGPERVRARGGGPGRRVSLTRAVAGRAGLIRTDTLAWALFANGHRRGGPRVRAVEPRREEPREFAELLAEPRAGRSPSAARHGEREPRRPRERRAPPGAGTPSTTPLRFGGGPWWHDQLVELRRASSRRLPTRARVC